MIHSFLHFSAFLLDFFNEPIAHRQGWRSELAPVPIVPIHPSRCSSASKKARFYKCSAQASHFCFDTWCALCYGITKGNLARTTCGLCVYLSQDTQQLHSVYRPRCLIRFCCDHYFFKTSSTSIGEFSKVTSGKDVLSSSTLPHSEFDTHTTVLSCIDLKGGLSVNSK